MIVPHQRADEHALPAPLLKLGDLVWGELLAAPEDDSSGLGELDAVHLALGPQLGLELGNGAEHVEEQPTGGGIGVDLLVEHLEMNTLASQLLGDLTQVQR